MKIPLIYDTAKASLVVFIMLALLVGTAYLSFQVGQWRAGENDDVLPDTVYVDRVLTKRDTVRYNVPKTVVIFKKDTTAVERSVCLSIPRELLAVGTIVQQPVVDSAYDSVSLTGNLEGTLREVNYKFKLLPQNGVLVKPKRVTITAFDPNLTRWTQDYYAVPRRRFNLNVWASTEYLSTGQSIVASDVGLTFKRLNVSGGVFADPVQGDVGWRARFQYKIY